MKLRTKHVLPWLVAAAVSAFSVMALAMPKAAEHEDAPVNVGPDVARPTPYAKTAKPAKKQASRNTKPAAKGKPVKMAKPLKKAKARSKKK